MRRFVIAVALSGAASLVVGGCAGRQPTAAEEKSLVDERSPFAFHRALTYTLLKTGQFKKALLNARVLPLLRPDDAEAHYLLGRVQAGLELHDAALESLGRAYRLSPTFLPTITTTAMVHDARREHARAQRWHRRALAFGPHHPVLLNNLGFSLYLEGRVEAALRVYQRALRYDGGSRRLHNNLGFALGRLGRFDEAEKHFRIGGRAGDAMNNLGLVRESRGELEVARDYFQAALEAEPGLEPARANLARVVEKLGQLSAATPLRPTVAGGLR